VFFPSLDLQLKHLKGPKSNQLLGPRDVQLKLAGGKSPRKSLGFIGLIGVIRFLELIGFIKFIGLI
jgi:hypothetical protein